MFKLILEKAEEPEIKLLNIHWIIKKARVPEKKDIKKRWQEYTEEPYRKILIIQITVMV